MKNPKAKLPQTLSSLPSLPGVYKMIDEEGKVIYVGKAKNLSKRVRQYFQKSKTLSERTRKMVENTDDIKYVVVDSELEALILELNLIKELRPKYNVLLKDDKNFVYIKITNEDFPRIQIVRKIDDKKSTYFGPKTAKHKVEKTFKILKKLFPFRHCTLDLKQLQDGKVEVTRKTIKYPCLDYYIKRCMAPCISNCTKEEYLSAINNVKRFFEGKHEEIIKSLYEEMHTLAAKKEFEKAAKLRDRIKNVESILEKQKISDPNAIDRDIINYVIEEGRAFFNLFQIRGGKLINQENFALHAKLVDEKDEDSKKELLGSFLEQYYEKTTNIPKEILIPHEPDERTIDIKLTIPQKGEKSRLLELSYKNAKVFADRNRANWEEEGGTKNILEELKSQFKLKKPPKRIECYDISHLAGTETVGSMIVFANGTPKAQDYRKFRIRTVIDKPDDYKSLEELLTRRLNHLKDELSEYKIKKAVKKDQKAIEEIIKKEDTLDDRDIDYKTFITAKKDGKIYGFVREKKLEENTKISSLWVAKEARGQKLGHKLLKALIKNSKAKRLYISCLYKLKDYYEQIGFTEIKALPKDLKKDLEYFEIELVMAYDNTKKEDKSFSSIPDLIIIDGGKGQLSTAEKVLKNFKLEIPVISIAKENEEIFIPGQKESLKLDKTNQILKLIQHARDEAHRFAISYNRNLRSKKLTK
jgi:excinuclease ABC subunit C